MAWRDEWPLMTTGEQYDGKRLFNLVQNERSPFEGVWDVKLLIREVEEKLGVRVVDIPSIERGSNNYGFYINISAGSDLLARLARGDVNMPDFDGLTIDRQITEVEFEAAIYNVLRDEPDIRVSRLLYHRIPKLSPGPKTELPTDIVGRRLFVFERAVGANNVWKELTAENKLVLLDQLASIRAALFNYSPPSEFIAKYVLARIFDVKPEAFTVSIAPTRDFWLHVLETKVKATIKEEGDRIGWEDDEETVGPIALAAKQSLLKVIPHLLPQEESEVLYRLVLEHGDFGIHNTSITTDEKQKPLVTSLYDWEGACIVPALLSDPLVAVSPVDLMTNDQGEPAVSWIPDAPTANELEEYAAWSRFYIKRLYEQASDYERAIRAGQHVRHLWFALRDWHGGESERFFGDLGAWAETRMRELDVL